MAVSLQMIDLPDNGRLALRARFNTRNYPTLLFLHGLGDSSLAWGELFADERFAELNLLAPDLAGFGETGAKNGAEYGFATQIRLVGQMLDHYRLGELFVIGHSMSGVMGGWLVAALLEVSGRQRTSRLTSWTGFQAVDLLPQASLRDIELRGFVSVEGTIVAEDASISNRAVQAAKRDRYDRWYEAFLELSNSPAWLADNPGATHYRESILRTLPGAFLACARDLNRWKELSTEPPLTHAADLLRALDLPAAYLYGSRSVHPNALAALEGSAVELQGFEGAGHWLMKEQSGPFRAHLKALVQ